MLAALRHAPLCLLLAAPTLGQGAAEIFTDSFYVATRAEATVDLDGDGDHDTIEWFWNNCWNGSLFGCSRISMYVRENRRDGELHVTQGQTITNGFWGGSEFWLNIDNGGTFESWDEPGVWVGDLDADPTRTEMVFFRGAVVTLVQVRLTGESPKRHVIEALDVIETDPACNANRADSERAITVADFDADGDLDLALTNSVQLFLMLQEGNSLQFVEGNAVQLDPSFPCTLVQSGRKMDLEVGEFNGDGRPDVAAIRQFLSSVAGWQTPTFIVTPVAGGQFFPPQIVDLDVGGHARLAMGDVDGDGDEDGVIFGLYGYQIWRRGPSGEMTLEPLRAGGPATDLADLDGDGDLDGICCGGGGGGPIGPNSSTEFMICMNDGAGNFDHSVAFPSRGALHVAGVLDVDGDGDVEVLGGRSLLVNHLRTGSPFCLAGLNSTGAHARLSASGSSSIERDDLTISATGLPPMALALLFHGQSEMLPGQTPLGAGHLCVGGTIQRVGITTSSPVGSASLAPTLADDSALGVLPEAGDVLRFQLWFRDGLGGSNATAGMRVVVTP